MSTIYVFHSECSTVDTIASGDRFLLWDTSTGRTEYALGSDIVAYVGAATNSGGTYNSAVYNSAMLNGTFSVSSSLVLGSTLSAKIGFYGAAGTSAATTIVALTTTFTTNGNQVAFSTSANGNSMISAINSLIVVLQAVGIVKGP